MAVAEGARDAVRSQRRRGDDDFAAAGPVAGVADHVSTTAGTNNGSVFAAAARALRRQPNSCCGESPCRRATEQTEAPLVKLSATIFALSSAPQARRRPAPVKTSIRRTGSVLALCSVIFLNLTTKSRRRLSNHAPFQKEAPDDRLPSTAREARPRSPCRHSSCSTTTSRRAIVNPRQVAVHTSSAISAWGARTGHVRIACE